MLRLIFALAILLAPAVWAAPAPSQQPVGLLIMAHGGEPDWNAEVERAVAAVAHRGPVAVAFGMADADSLQDAASRLEAQGARRIVVVRLFVSGDSFLERTEKILGLRPGAGPRPANPPPDHGAHGHGGHGAHGGHGGLPPGVSHDPDSMPLWRLASRSEFALAREGLMDSDRMGRVLAERAAALSKDPSQESVLVLGHGPADDKENQRWLERMDALAEHVRSTAAFRQVRVETLREDWPTHRAEATSRIREYVEEAGKNGGRVLVVPFRVSGFGPYREVLDGLAYEASGVGLLPHAEISRWIEETAARAAAAKGW